MPAQTAPNGDNLTLVRVARPADVERPQDRRDPDEERRIRKVHPDADPTSSTLYQHARRATRGR